MLVVLVGVTLDVRCEKYDQSNEARVVIVLMCLWLMNKCIGFCDISLVMCVCVLVVLVD